MQKQLQGKRVAILVADGFEQVEMTDPRQALDDRRPQLPLDRRDLMRQRRLRHVQRRRGLGQLVEIATADKLSPAFPAIPQATSVLPHCSAADAGRDRQADSSTHEPERCRYRGNRA